MLKKIMLYLLMVQTAGRFLALTFVFSIEIEHLPISVYISAGAVTLFGIVLICKNIVSSISTKDLIAYYAAESASVVLNLIFMKLFSRAELGLLDFSIIGTILDIVIGLTLIALAVRETKYVCIRVKSDV